MRIRQVKPAFWSDSRIAELPAGVRLFYIGLWMLADDAGWFRMEPAQIGNELFGYDTRTKRERNVVAYLDALTIAGRIEQHECGHGYIPTLVEHQHMAAETKRVVTIKREHEHCPRKPAITREASGFPDTVRSVKGTVSDGQKRNGTPRAGEPDGPLAESLSEFRYRVPRPS